MSRERRFFSEEFKREAVNLASQPGANKSAIARDLGIGANLLERWCRGSDESEMRTKVGDKVSVAEYERMRRELAKVKTERDILKKALGYFAADPK
jgi:transposase